MMYKLKQIIPVAGCLILILAILIILIQSIPWFLKVRPGGAREVITVTEATLQDGKQTRKITLPCTLESQPGG